ncbi:MAG: hypothetical protein ACRYFA_06755 [Janthinobacterium lividum]
MILRANKTLILSSLAFLLTFSLSSCSKKLTFVTSTVVPAAEGSAKIKKDDNKNKVVEVKVIHLTNPSRLQPAKKTYVVWMVTENNGTKNIGQLQSNSGLFSSTLKGELTTVTPYNPKKIFITAEDDAAIQFPGTQVVLTTP